MGLIMSTAMIIREETFLNALEGLLLKVQALEPSS